MAFPAFGESYISVAADLVGTIMAMGHHARSKIIIVVRIRSGLCRLWASPGPEHRERAFGEWQCRSP